MGVLWQSCHPLVCICRKWNLNCIVGNVQLCKIDSEGKARKVVGCSCVVVKVWISLTWFDSHPSMLVTLAHFESVELFFPLFFKSFACFCVHWFLVLILDSVQGTVSQDKKSDLSGYENTVHSWHSWFTLWIGHACWLIDLLSGLWWGDRRTECRSGICQEPLRQHVPSMGIFLSLIWFWKVYSWISNVDLFFHFYSHPDFWIWWGWTVWHIFLVSSRGFWIKAEGQYSKRDLCTLSVPLLKFIDKVIN